MSAALLTGGSEPEPTTTPTAGAPQPPRPTAPETPPPAAPPPFSIDDARASALLTAALEGDPRELLAVREQHPEALERALGGETVALLALVAGQRQWLADIIGDASDAPPRPASVAGALDDARPQLEQLTDGERRGRIETALVRLRSDTLEAHGDAAWRLRLRPTDPACRDALTAAAPDDFVLTPEGLTLEPTSEQSRARWRERRAYIELPRVDRFARIDLDLLGLPRRPLLGIELFAADAAGAGSTPLAHAHAGMGGVRVGQGPIPDEFFDVALDLAGRGEIPLSVPISLGNDATTVRCYSEPAKLPVGRMAGPLTMRIYLAPDVPFCGICLRTLKNTRPGDAKPTERRAADEASAPGVIGYRFGRVKISGDPEISTARAAPREDCIALVDSGRSEVRMRFRLDRLPELGLLCVEHTATLTQGKGYDPIDITLNGRPVAFDLDPETMHWSWDRFDVTALLVEGDNEVVIRLGPATSHHWLRNLEIRYRD